MPVFIPHKTPNITVIVAENPLQRRIPEDTKNEREELCVRQD